jgi:uncharacterized protein YceH (UPF0502 family)
MNTLVVQLQRETQSREQRLRELMGPTAERVLDDLRLESTSNLGRPYVGLLEERINQLEEPCPS